MKTAITLLLSFLWIASLRAQTPAAAPAADGSALKADDIAKKWQKAPEPPATPTTGLPSGIRTRGIRPNGLTPVQPQVRTRGAALSQQAVDANAAALENLRNRGVKILDGAEAVAAQAAQDQALGAATSPQPRVEASSTPPPVFVSVPVVPEKQIAFRLRFKLDSTDLADEESSRLIGNIAQAMKELPDAVFLLEGHTCDLGESAHNQRLSEARALRVRTLLGDLGIAANRLLSVGHGESQCEVPNTSDANRALNRRVVIGPIELSNRP